MSFIARLRYAIGVLVAVSMVLVVVLVAGAMLGIVHGFEVTRLAFHPLITVPVLALGFAFAPSLSERLPISGDRPESDLRVKPRFSYLVRATALAVVALTLVLVVELADLLQ